ncbi:MAG: phosphomannomutase/phosphoglucomutase, partial [Solirubrobacteraceae bacterium]
MSVTPQTNDAMSWPVDMPRTGNDPISHAVGPISPDIFREYDLRGMTSPATPEPDETINGYVANRLGRAFGTYLAARDILKIAVGQDSRSYSEALAGAFIQGLLSTGREVSYIGLATSPMVYFAQHALGGIAGTAVTASHNPNGWAGFKLSDAPSLTLGPDGIAEVRQIAESRQFVQGTGSYSEVPILEKYVATVVEKVGHTRPLRIVLDGGNGIAGPIAHRVFEAAGHDVTSINLELDWTFPNHEPDPEALSARDQISKAVVDQKADVGLSLDGDGDRIGVTDENGAVVWSDMVLAIMARDSLNRHPGATIVYDVKCSRAVGEVITKAGGKPLMWKTGHSHIKTKAREVQAPFSGERSGHFFDAGDYYGYDDAVYATLRFARIIAEADKSVSDLVRELPQYVSTPTMHAHAPDATKYGIVDEFAALVRARTDVKEVIDVNGIRAEFDDGWFLVRASSNIPALVIVAEADSAVRLRELYDVVREGLSSFADVGTAWENDPF